MLNRAIWAWLSITVTAFHGCGLMLNGTHQPVKFNSDPAGASVVVRDTQARRSCNAPCILDLKRARQPAILEVSMSGRQTYSGEMISSEPTATFANISCAIIDGLLIIPGIVDLATATFWEYPDRVTALLPPEGNGNARVETHRIWESPGN